MTVLPSVPPPYRALVMIGTAILAVLILVVLSLARSVLIPLALAVLLAFILAPVVARVQHWGLGRVPAVILVAALAFLMLGGVGLAVLLQFQSLDDDLPRYQENVTQKIGRFRGAVESTLLDKVQNAVAAINEAIFKPVRAEAKDSGQKTIPVEVRPSGAERLGAIAGPALGLLGSAALVSILVIFMLISREDLRDRLIRLVGHGHVTGTTKALDDAGRRISAFLLMQLLVNAAYGLVLSVGLLLIGVPYAFLWGLLTTGLRFIPRIGIALAALVLLIFTVAAFPGWTQTFVVLGLIVVLEASTANAVEPLLVGRSTGVSPVALLVAAAFWTWLWGPVGLFLSTPLTVCFVVLGKHVPALAFFNVLLGDKPALDTDVRYYQRLLARDPDEALDLVEAYLGAHPPEQVYDDVLLPALVLTRQDRGRGVLTAEEEESLFQGMRDVLEEIAPAPPQAVPDAAGPSGGARPKVLVFGCPAGGQAEELALLMLRQLLEPAGCPFEVFSASTLPVDVPSRVREEQPALVCVATLPPAGLARARYLCKRLRAQSPGLKVVVGRWGPDDNSDKAAGRLLSAGADTLATSLLATRDQLLRLIQTAPSSVDPLEPGPGPQGRGEECALLVGRGAPG